MEALRQKAKELLEAGTVKAILGYEQGTFGKPRPVFIQEPRQAGRLIFDETCHQNLAKLLSKEEVRKLFPLAVVARPETLRALLQLAAECQIKDGEILVLAMGSQDIQELPSAQAMEEHAAFIPQEISPEDRALLDRLAAMSREERWAFWTAELSRCIKCYACRNSCPMCYCSHCTMDCNRPQWIPVPSHLHGNVEYHMVRAMHLAGRCVQCGECGRACPVGIPVHLLSFHAEDSVRRMFGQRAGNAAKLDYALSTFKPDDKESFIR